MNLVIDHHVPRKIFHAAPQGIVGSTEYDIRLKQSCPELTPRYDKTFNMKSISKRASSVGTLAKVVTKKGKNTSAVGWYKQDLIPVDVSQISTMGSMYRYNWNNQKAQVQKAKVTGDYFLPPPGGYDKSQANGVLRGNAYPQPITLSSTIPSVVTQSTQTTQTDTSKNTTGLFSNNQPTQVTPLGGTPSVPGGAFMEGINNSSLPSSLNPMVQARRLRPPPIDTSFVTANVPASQPNIGDVVTNRSSVGSSFPGIETVPSYFTRSVTSGRTIYPSPLMSSSN